MSLLLKDVDAISHLSLYDVRGTPGVAADLGHINTKAKVRPGPPFRAGCAPRFRPAQGSSPLTPLFHDPLYFPLPRWRSCAGDWSHGRR